MNDNYRITSEAALKKLLGEPNELAQQKVVSHLDESMVTFIERSPLVFVSTIDDNGHIDSSPKGDPCGFVKIDDKGNLLIPERPGNKLTFGFNNILRNGEIGLIFVVPNMRETLRIKGTATLHNDPELLEQLQANGKPALLCTYVNVKACFFHCGKAMIRSKLWKPETWKTHTESLMSRQISNALNADKEMESAIEEAIESSYIHKLY